MAQLLEWQLNSKEKVLVASGYSTSKLHDLMKKSFAWHTTSETAQYSIPILAQSTDAKTIKKNNSQSLCKRLLYLKWEIIRQN